MFISTNYVGCGHSIDVFKSETQKGIKLDKVKGTWSVIGNKFYDGVGRVFLCEHDKFGDEVPCVIIDKDYNVILTEVWNGFLDYEEAVEWEKYEVDMFSVLKESHIGPYTFKDGTIQDTTIYKLCFEGKEQEVVLIDTTMGSVNFINIYYLGNRPKTYGILEEKLKAHYNANKH